MKNIITASFIVLMTLSCSKSEKTEEDSPNTGIPVMPVIFIDAVTYEKIPGVKIFFVKDKSNNQWTVMDSATTDSEGQMEFSGSDFFNYCLLYKEDYLPTIAVIPGLKQSHPGPIPDGFDLAMISSAVVASGTSGTSGNIDVVKVHREAFLQVDVNMVNPLPTPGKYFLELEMRGRDGNGTTLYWKIYDVSSSYEVLPANNQANLQLAGNLTYNAKMKIYNELPNGSVAEVKSNTKTVQVKPKENNQVQFDF